VTEKGNVFQRWARLKHEAKTTAQQAEPVPIDVEAATVHPGINAAVQEPFDPASLPSIGSITADTDIVGFLKSGVPTALTRAALRRAWTSDPAIRDFIGIAENQWDFNDPNGISGFGRLDATESGVIFLAQVSSTPGGCLTCSRKGRRPSSVSPRTPLVPNSPRPISMRRLTLANRLPPIASFHRAQWPKQVLRRMLYMALKNTMRPAVVAVMGAPCQSSAGHCRCRRSLHFFKSS
jgi:hypothetical protein